MPISERWGLLVTLDGVDVSDSLVGELRIEAEESASGICQFSMFPPAGTVDPNDYENVPIVVSYLTKDAAGETLTTTARFSGITTLAVFESDSGVLEIQASNDLQTKLEALDRAGIDSLISSGSWSKHVFDDGADGWQYAQDRLSTTPAEVHVTADGALEVTDWAVKVTPDVTLTDSDRFAGTLNVSRVTRRDLISKNTIAIDFRFTRLRHREIVVSFTYTGGLCNYLDGISKVPQRSMIQSAADSNKWTRISDIAFTSLPPTGTYCGDKNFLSTDLADTFCLDATWTSARRWAQTITEEFSIEVNAPDIETAVGVQPVTESYGVEAIADSSDFERITDYRGPPAGSVLSGATDDWQLDADTTAHGRAELEAAQTVAIAKASTEILGRARGNRVSVGAVYDQSITLASTVRINTPHLVCKGKVFAYTETFNLRTGQTDMTLELAISRHGGSGTATSDPIVAPTPPTQTPETPTSRTLSLGVISGGKTGDPADNPTWTGYITNAYGGARTDPSNMYQERFVIEMPEIEQTARNATIEPASSSYEVEVPEDELTLIY